MRQTLACLVVIASVGLAGAATPAEAGRLAAAWNPVIEKYPPPVPTETETRTLAEAYSRLVAAYPASMVRADPGRGGTEPDPWDSAWSGRSGEPRGGASVIREGGEEGRLCRRRLAPYQDLIRTASVRFNVPEAVIGGVILTESSGNPRAAASTSSAKGLMQTIDATFALAADHLAPRGVFIHDPFDPEHSIMAGTWYLSYVFELARADGLVTGSRKDPGNWKKALEYYYAGPVWGKNPRPVFKVDVGGRPVTIAKDRYARRVLKYADMI